MHTAGEGVGGSANYVLIPAASHPSHPQHHLSLILVPLPSPNSLLYPFPPDGEHSHLHKPKSEHLFLNLSRYVEMSCHS